MSAGASYRWIHRVWYEDARLGWLLLPLSGLYWLITLGRRFLYRCGVLKTQHVAVPVIVVGNITAGGTGKTPTVIWLARELRGHGLSPGIVSRGYGGSKSDSPMRVDSDSAATLVGDEPVLLARRSECPVIVDADRLRAAAMLADDGVDVVIADDGLQHYRLGRDYEICVIDGSRGLGNRRLLPAGPLRELPGRLDDVDQLLVNGPMRMSSDLSVTEQNAVEFELLATEACRLNGSLVRPIERFSARFFDLLRSFGIQVLEHSFVDHAALAQKDIEFDDDFAVFMTEKDAVKFGRKIDDKFWFVPVEFHIDPVLALPIIGQIESRLELRKTSQFSNR
jgi:tetraacyldisaccharide 4'-kinase